MIQDGQEQIVRQRRRNHVTQTHARMEEHVWSREEQLPVNAQANSKVDINASPWTSQFIGTNCAEMQSPDKPYSAYISVQFISMSTGRGVQFRFYFALSMSTGRGV